MSQKDGDLPLKGSAGEEYDDPMEARAMAWMSRAKQGDPAAFDELTRALRSRAFRLAQAWVGSRDDALELAQEAFLKTYRARDTYREGEPFLPWFHRILRNTCFSFLRSAKRLRPRSLSAPRPGSEEEGDWEIEDATAPAPAEGVGEEERRAAFWQGFKRLSARDREILALRHFQELSYSQIARARLRTALEGRFGEEFGSPSGKEARR